MGRKLVSVQRILSLNPIQNRRMVLAGVDNWSCAVNPDEYDVGDLVVFFEIDAFLPAEDERFACLKNFTVWRGQRGYHVKSIMVGKSMSQGLIMPLAKFPEIRGVLQELEQTSAHDEAVAQLMQMSFDDLLGVKRLWPKAERASRSFGRPPIFFPKPVIGKVENWPKILGPSNNSIYQESTKMAGCSMTVYFVQRGSAWYKSLYTLPEGFMADMPEGRIGVCSKSHDIPEHIDSPFWPVTWNNGLPEKLAKLNKNIAIQGELCGSALSSNAEGFERNRHQFYVFKIFDIDEQQALFPWQTEATAKDLGLEHVPVSGYVRLHEIAKSYEDLAKRAEGLGVNGKPREGLVYKNVADGKSFKVMCNNNLLEDGKDLTRTSTKARKY